MPYRIRDVLSAVFCALAWAAMVVLRKAGLNSLHVFSVLVLSRVVTVLVIGLGLAVTRRQVLILDRGVIRYVVLLGTLNLVLNWMGNQGMQWSTATVGSVLFKTDVLFTIMLGWLFLSERVCLRQLPMVVAALVGCAMVLLVGDSGPAAVGSRPLAGNALCVLFGLVLTINAILIRAKLSGMGKMQLAFWNSLIGLMLFGVCWFLTADVPAELAKVAGEPRLVLILVGAGVAAAITFLSYYQAIWNLPVWVVRAILLLSPALALLMAASFLGERAGAWQIVGMMLLLGGTASVVVSGKSRVPPATASEG